LDGRKCAAGTPGVLSLLLRRRYWLGIYLGSLFALLLQALRSTSSPRGSCRFTLATYRC
jgi:hypothetical protein